MSTQRRYQLYCLQCRRDTYTSGDLVDMQEHLIRDHGIAQTEFRRFVSEQPRPGEIVWRLHGEPMMKAVEYGLNPSYKTGSSRHQAYVREGAVNAIVNALNHAKGSVTKAAKLLGLQRTYLHRLMRELGIEAAPRGPRPLTGTPQRGGYHAQVDAAQRRALVHALTITGGNLSRAGRQLGLSRTRMTVLVKKYGLRKQFPMGPGGDWRT